ncbi:leukocyte cell-derived chemotaxin-2-like protein [Labeo rohita]|uniref:Leukocyte cell-derived chemotaxin-2-like protein n=1 Tax=Labeo rohita TaxID=84645 RepID=A0A498LKI5_LABRO|nr:leukocyte cell-derived chemotaxin-2-like protein [Labeo rohita]
MRLYILFGFLLLAVICSCGVDASQVKFGPLCSGNPSNHIRECDKKGCGAYGAPRNNGKGKHEGLDIVCADGATVFAPFDVKLNGKAVPYRVNNAINDGVNLSGGVLFRSYVEANAVTFGPLCCGNPSNSKRGCDTMYGCGYHGASCGDWTHECLDIVCADGVTVLTPFDVMLNQKAAPYINQPKKEPINNGTTLCGEAIV